MSASTSSGKTKSKDTILHENIRGQDISFDFVIKVENKSFLVHTKTLIAHSEYFRAMLDHNTKESQEGVVDVKNLTVAGVRECIDFMYTGEADINTETVLDILKTADMWQLCEVRESCSKLLKEKVNSGNCVSTLNTATKYCMSELQERAQQFYDKNFDMELSELLQLPKDDFVEFLKIKTLSNNAGWDVIINWIKHDPEERSEVIFELFSLLNWKNLPSAELLETMWKESILRNSSQCKELLLEKLFLDWRAFTQCLDVESYFVLKQLSDESKFVMKQIKDKLSQFFKSQIVLLSQKSEFMCLDSKEIISLFSLGKPDVFAPEKWWWNTAVTWVNHDPDRKKLFPKLIKFIDFKKLPKSFVKSIVENEPLVIDSKQCRKIVMDGLMEPKQKNEEFITVLYSDGRIRALDINTRLWTDLPEVPKPVENAEIFYFLGKLCLINGSRLFYLQNSEWVERESMSTEEAGKRIVASDGDFIYVLVHAQRRAEMFCYDSLTDSWSEIELPPDIGITPRIATLNGCVYAITNIFVSSEIYKFENQSWSKTLLTANMGAKFAVSVDEKIYYCQNIRRLGFIEPRTGKKQLKDIPEFNQNETIANKPRKPKQGVEGKVLEGSSFSFSGIKTSHANQLKKKHESFFSFASESYKTTFQAMINFAGRLVVVHENEIYFYDNVCHSWSYFGDIPKFVTKTKEEKTEINIISVSEFLQHL